MSAYDTINFLYGTTKNLSFMNHGYSPIDERLLSSDIFLKQSACLYLKVVDGIETENKSLLEIGCGRGGGLDVIHRYYPDLQLVGCDLNYINVSTAKSLYSHLPYQVGSAEDLPYSNKSFDYILNIESSHEYGDIDKFYSETQRVLNDSGKLLYSDICCSVDEMNDRFRKFDKYFEIVKFEDITENSLNSCIEMVKLLDDFKRDIAYGHLYRICKDKIEQYRSNLQLSFIMHLSKRL